jgi:flagellar L-ring protein precursor FlgH
MKNTIKISGLVVGLLFYLSLSGCSVLETDQNNAGLVAPQGSSLNPVLQPEFTGARPSEGSLWVSREGSIFEDSKANGIGDTVIVDIIENSSSSMDVNTQSGRSSAMDIGVPKVNLFGYTTDFGAALGDTSLIGTNFSNSFDGEGSSDRSGQVTASIAARVTEVLPNGNLSLFGRRAMKVNNEVQYITVAGIIRPQDVSAANRVLSTSLADARIEYYGKGALADKQQPGWGTRIIDNLWPW